MPKQVATRVLTQAEKLGRTAENLKILLLGWSYKPGISDVRETPSEPLASTLINAGCEVFVWDPFIQEEDMQGIPGIWIQSPFDANADVVILCTAHQEVLEINWKKLRATSELGLFYDGRRVTNFDELQNAGWITTGVGYP